MVKKNLLWFIAIWIVLAGTTLQSAAMIKDNDDDDWKDDLLPDVSLDFLHKRPVIEPWLMTSMVSHRNLTKSSINNMGGFDLRVGYAEKTANKASLDLVNYKMNYPFIGYTSKEFAITKSETGAIETNMLRFGYGNKEGLGYNLDNDVSIVPYRGFGLLWTQFSVKNLPLDTIEKSNIDLFNNAFRFGKQSEAGMLIQFTKNSGINIGYEYSVVFSRHLFWYWAGSEILEDIAQGMADSFVRSVAKSSPKSAPIVAFVLKNGISYGLYELRKKNMNWPFDTAPAMSYSAFKIGVNLAF